MKRMYVIFLLQFILFVCISISPNGYLYEQGQRIEIAMNYDFKLPFNARLLHRYDTFGGFDSEGDCLEIYDLKYTNKEKLITQMKSNGWVELPIENMSAVSVLPLEEAIVRQITCSYVQQIYVFGNDLLLPAPSNGYYFKESWKNGYRIGLLDCDEKLIYFYCCNDD